MFEKLCWGDLRVELDIFLLFVKNLDTKVNRQVHNIMQYQRINPPGSTDQQQKTLYANRLEGF